MIIIESFQWLVKNELVHIYGYVIMPNHIHVLWEQLKMKGKETPKKSFEKFTGHMFLNEQQPFQQQGVANVHTSRRGDPGSVKHYSVLWGRLKTALTTEK